MLPPGHVLAQRTTLSERAGGASPGRKPEGAVEVLPAREAGDAASAGAGRATGGAVNPLPDLVAAFGPELIARLVDQIGADPQPGQMIEVSADALPERVADHAADASLEPEAGRAADAVPEHIDDELPVGVAGRAPALVPEQASAALPDRASDGTRGGALHQRSRLGARVAAGRVLAVAIVACALVLGFMLAGRFYPDDDLVENPAPREVAAPSVEPRPAPPVASSAATPEQPQSPEQEDETAAHRATERPAGRRWRRGNEGRETRRLAPAPTLRRPEPLGGETPSWSRP